MRKQKKFYFLVLVITILFCSTTSKINAQVEEEWVATFDGIEATFASESLKKMAIDDEGNVYVTGETPNDFLEIWPDIMTIKYDSNGNELWRKRYDNGFDGEERVEDIAVDQNGNVYITGSSMREVSSGEVDLLTIKYNQHGNMVWVERFRYADNTVNNGQGLEIDEDGNIYVLGGTTGRGNGDLVTIKYSPGGSILWQVYFDGKDGSTDFPQDIVLDNDENIVILGSIDDGQTSYDIGIAKYNFVGGTLWKREYLTTAYPKEIDIDSENNVYIGGTKVNSSNDIMLVKFNSSGVFEWIKTYNGLADRSDSMEALTIDGEDNIFMTGSSESSFNNEDIIVLKYGGDGRQLAENSFSESFDLLDKGFAITHDIKGNIYVGGQLLVNGQFDGVLLKYASDLSLIWSVTYDSMYSEYDGFNNIAVDLANNIYVAGVFTKEIGDNDYLTIKYDQLPPDVTLDLDVLTPIVSRGEQLIYDATFTNNSDEVVTFDYASKVKLPNGEFYEEFIQNPTEFTLQPQESRLMQFRHDVPQRVYAGDYQYWGGLGEGLNDVWTQSKFNFTITEL